MPWTRDMHGRLERREEIAVVSSPRHHLLLLLPVELLQHAILTILCDDDLDRTLALRVVCKGLQPLAEHHAQWLQHVFPTLLSAEYRAQLAATAASSLPAAAVEEKKDDDSTSAAAPSSTRSACSCPPYPAARYELADVCWLSQEMRRWSVRDGKGGRIAVAAGDTQAQRMYGLSADELQPMYSWLAGRRYPAMYRHSMDLLHLSRCNAGATRE
jgi:hypothetical protein